MPANLDKTFASDPEWKEVAEQVDKGLREFGYYNYELLLRPATAEEQIEISEECGVQEFVHVDFDPTECSAVFVFGTEPSTGCTALSYVSPNDFAMINIVDTLDQMLVGSDPLDRDVDFPDTSFKVVDGGKH